MDWDQGIPCLDGCVMFADDTAVLLPTRKQDDIQDKTDQKLQNKITTEIYKTQEFKINKTKPLLLHINFTIKNRNEFSATRPQTIKPTQP